MRAMSWYNNFDGKPARVPGPSCGERNLHPLMVGLLGALAATAAGGCGSGSKPGGIACVADSICQPSCAADPDCAGPRDAAPDLAGGGMGGSGTGGVSATGGALGTGGGSGTGGSGTGGVSATGGALGTGGRTGTGGTGGASGTGGGGGQPACGTYGVSGSVTFTGVATIAFDRVTATVSHKRDVDEFEDRCLNRLILQVGFADGCNMQVTASDCLDSAGRMRVTGISFSADSQCPSFPDAIEGSYAHTSGSIEGSWVAISAPKVPDRNVATSCVQERFEIVLAGRLNRTTGTSNTLAFGPDSMLVVTGTFLSAAFDRACPTACPGTGTGGAAGTGGAVGTGGRPGTGGRVGTGGNPGTGGSKGTGGAGTGGSGTGGCQTDSQCTSLQSCYQRSCVPTTAYGPCTATARCPTGTTCMGSGNGAGWGCVPNCSGTAACAQQPTSGTVVAECSGSFCLLDCNAGGTCPDGMVCSSGLCYWPP